MGFPARFSHVQTDDKLLYEGNGPNHGVDAERTDYSMIVPRRNLLRKGNIGYVKGTRGYKMRLELTIQTPGCPLKLTITKKIGRQDQILCQTVRISVNLYEICLTRS